MYTGKDTLQKNQLVELGFVMDTEMDCVILNKANVPVAMQHQPFCKCFKTATDMDNLQVPSIGGITQTRYEYFNKEILGFVKNLQEGDEAGTFTSGKYGKLNNKEVAKSDI